MRKACLLLIGMFGVAGAAQAAMPVFSAECPQGNRIDADRSGTVRVNGSVASVQKFNDGYYEARHQGVTYSIMPEAGTGQVEVRYNPPGASGGNCTVLSAQSGSDISPQGSGNFLVSGVSQGDLLNVRRGPSASSDIVGALANGDQVRNLGCESHGGSRWCHIQMLDEMRSEGWVNARYLTETGTPTSSGGAIDHGGVIENNCAEAVARKVGVSRDDVIVTNTTISEGTGLHVVHVGVPYGKADWICEADRHGKVVNVFYSGE